MPFSHCGDELLEKKGYVRHYHQAGPIGKMSSLHRSFIFMMPIFSVMPVLTTRRRLRFKHYPYFGPDRDDSPVMLYYHRAPFFLNRDPLLFRMPVRMTFPLPGVSITRSRRQRNRNRCRHQQHSDLLHGPLLYLSRRCAGSRIAFPVFRPLALLDSKERKNLRSCGHDKSRRRRAATCQLTTFMIRFLRLEAGSRWLAAIRCRYRGNALFFQMK
jgi:hypothetical protein